MPRIDFTFQGSVSGAAVEKATARDGSIVSVSHMTGKELCEKLESGELLISLGDYLYETDRTEIEIEDFTPNE